MGYTNSRVIIRWWNHITNKIGLTTSVRFDEENFVSTDNETPPGCLPESLNESGSIIPSDRLTYESVNITDHPFIDS